MSLSVGNQLFWKKKLCILSHLYLPKKIVRIEDEEIIDDMCEHTQENAVQDFSIDEVSISEFKFHFVIEYIHSHVPVGLVPEMEEDRIMEYVNDHWKLFGQA